MKISKELFEIIYNVKISKLEVDEFSYIWVNIDSEHLSRFDSINNFFFKCKDWAYNKGYYLASNRYSDGACCQYFTEDSRECDECGEVKTITIHADSEQQAVFNVCQCILENKTTKQQNNKI